LADLTHIERSTSSGGLRLLVALLALLVSGLLVGGWTSVLAATGLAPSSPQAVAGLSPGVAAGWMAERNPASPPAALAAVSRGSSEAEPAGLREVSFPTAASPGQQAPSRHAATQPEVTDLLAIVTALIATMALIAWRRRV
jgi:hypothetical protein